LLSRNDQAEEKLHEEEVDSVLAGRLPDVSDLPSLLFI